VLDGEIHMDLNIYAKLGARGRAEVTALAIQHGLQPSSAT
jgi:DNA-binding NarL/FixJ family response regulator